MNLWTMLPWITVSVVLTAIVAGLAAWSLRPASSPESLPVIRFSHELSSSQQFDDFNEKGLALSRDAKQLVYSASGGLYLRSIGNLDAVLIAGTANEHPSFPFFSPDGTRIALTIDSGGNSDIWIWDIIREMSTRLTSNEASEDDPLWTPDGKRVLFESTREGWISMIGKTLGHYEITSLIGKGGMGGGLPGKGSEAWAGCGD